MKTIFLKKQTRTGKGNGRSSGSVFGFGYGPTTNYDCCNGDGNGCGNGSGYKDKAGDGFGCGNIFDFSHHDNCDNRGVIFTLTNKSGRSND